jgi:Cu-Zn family superoxide dismutase
LTSQGVGQSIGSVKITETDRGLEFTPDLRALPPGKHGFHIHAEGSCQPAMKEGKAVAAGAAGGHYDPQHTGKHEGRWAPGIWRSACWWSTTRVKPPADYRAASENAG